MSPKADNSERRKRAEEEMRVNCHVLGKTSLKRKSRSDLAGTDILPTEDNFSYNTLYIYSFLQTSSPCSLNGLKTQAKIATFQ